MSCLKCHVSNNNDNISCDGCSRIIHTDCAGLNTHELKVMSLRGGKRTLKYYCSDCEEGIRIIPKLLKRIDELEERINLVSQNSTNPVNPSINDSIAQELLERQKRSNTVVIFNLPEENNDQNDAQLILNELTNGRIAIVKSGRFGKRNRNGHRAMKITVESHEVASKIITANKNCLKGRNIYISADLTRYQRDSLNQLKKELATRTANGEENLVIKYVNGIPKITSKNSLN